VLVAVMDIGYSGTAGFWNMITRDVLGRCCYIFLSGTRSGTFWSSFQL